LGKAIAFFKTFEKRKSRYVVTHDAGGVAVTLPLLKKENVTDE
jgi:hypothetical protein